MGISGLLPFLKKSSVNCHVKQFKGQTVAVDAYCWLHKGAFSCADKLVMGEKTDAYVGYCMKLVNMLLSHDLKPILVFDGQPLPSKLGTEIKRRENRERYKAQAREFLRQGNTSKARECFQKCVDVTSVMALELIKACRARNIDCIVAPYEADAQLAFLATRGIAHLVITEDSDLLAFGCARVLFKMDMNGNGVLIEKDKLYLSLGGRAEFFNDEKFRRMCIMAGCDYLPSLPGIGLGKAFKFFSRTTNSDINSTLCRIPGCLAMSQLEVTTEYREAFVKAELTFLHQLVYDPIGRCLVPLTPYPPELAPSSIPFAGQYLEDSVAFQLAIGNLDAQTLGKLDDYHPDNGHRNAMMKKNSAVTKHPSIWSSSFTTPRPSEKPVAKTSPLKAATPVTRQTITTVAFSLQAKAEKDEDVTVQYIVDKQKESPTSPVLSRKRKRAETNENSSPDRNGLPAVLDPFAEPADDKTIRTPPSQRKAKNPFVKLKLQCDEEQKSPTTPSPDRRLVACTTGQVKQRTPDGREVVTSVYFAASATISEQTKTESHLSMSVASSREANGPFKPVVALVKNTSLSHTQKSPGSFKEMRPETRNTPSMGCRVAGLCRPGPKNGAQQSQQMRQLKLRDMFAVKQ